MTLVPGTIQDKDMLFQSCNTRRLQCLRHLMFTWHTCTTWAQQHVVNTHLAGAIQPCGSPDIPKVCTACAPQQEGSLSHRFSVTHLISLDCSTTSQYTRLATLDECCYLQEVSLDGC